MAAIDRETVSATVVKCLAAVLEIEPSTITESQSFKDDLGADSIALVEFVFDLESEFSAMVGEFSVDDEDLQKLATVGDAVDYVVAALGS
jgi:acyl carrier protein